MAVAMNTVERQLTRCLVRPGDLRPSAPGFEVIGAFNPAAVEVDGVVHLLVRVAEAPIQDRQEHIALPRADLRGGYEIDWFARDQVAYDDPRIVTLRETGHKRLTFVSHLRHAVCKDPKRVTWIDDEPTFFPEDPTEVYGVEDARATLIDGRVWVTYVAVSEHGIATSLASTDDFRTYRRHGVIFPTENKDVVLFPGKVGGGGYAALHRPYGHAPMGSREIWSARSPDLLHWGRHELVVAGGDLEQCKWVGAGAPPVLTDAGWLEVYHGVTPRAEGGVGTYHARVMILDPDQPSRVLHQGREPMLQPHEAFERTGFLNDVMFITGAVQRGEELYLYYGAGDATTAVTRVRTRDVVDAAVGDR